MEKTEHINCLDSLLPIKDALEAISGKWKLLIITSIASGNSRFKEIERSIPKLSSKVLAKELRDIETHLLIQRKVDRETSLIYYTLTPYAESLRDVMLALRTWGKGHREMVIANF